MEFIAKAFFNLYLGCTIALGMVVVFVLTDWWKTRKKKGAKGDYRGVFEGVKQLENEE